MNKGKPLNVMGLILFILATYLIFVGYKEVNLIISFYLLSLTMFAVGHLINKLYKNLKKEKDLNILDDEKGGNKNEK